MRTGRKKFLICVGVVLGIFLLVAYNTTADDVTTKEEDHDPVDWRSKGTRNDNITCLL
jgi:hypothetical protein